MNTRTVTIVLQKSPGKRGSDARGIGNVDFQVVSNGAVIQTGTTPANGEIRMRVRGGVSTLQLMVNGAPVADYEVRIRTAAVEATTQTIGQLRRLRMLGYHVGHDGTDQNGSITTINQVGDRAMLEFQADKDKKMDGSLDNATQTLLQTDAGA